MKTLAIPLPRTVKHFLFLIQEATVMIQVNSKHPRALYFQLLTDSLKKVRSGKHFKKMLDPYLNAPSDGEQDSSSEDEEMGCSPRLFTLP